MSERFLRMSEVRSRVSFSRSQIYLLISRNEFPQPVSLGARALAWLESEIDEWIASRIVEKRGKPAAFGRAAMSDPRIELGDPRHELPGGE